MEPRTATAEAKVEAAIENLNQAAESLPDAIKTIDADLSEQYAARDRLQTAPILPAEARREAIAEGEAARARVREDVLKIASGCSVPGEFRLLPTHHELRQPATQARLFDLMILALWDNLIKAIFSDAQIAKDWPAGAIGQADRASKIALLQKSILEKETTRETLAVKFAEIKIFVDRLPASPPEVILEFSPPKKWNREKFAQLLIEFRGMQHQEGAFDGKLAPLARDRSEFERQLRQGDFRFAPQEKARLENVIKGLESQILDLREKRAVVQTRMSALNQVLNNCQEFLRSKGIDSGLTL